MYKKLLNLYIYIFFAALLSTAPTSAQLFNFPTAPDVELLTTLPSAVSNQVIHRIYNKLVPAPPPLLSPVLSPNTFPVGAPLRAFPQSVGAPPPALLSSYYFPQPITPVQAPFIGAPTPQVAPFAHQVASFAQPGAPFAQQVTSFSQPIVVPPAVPGPLFPAVAQFIAPAPLRPQRIALPQQPRRRLRSRFNNRRRPAAIRQPPANLAYQIFGL